jgi:hypothetical protein
MRIALVLYQLNVNQGRDTPRKHTFVTAPWGVKVHRRNAWFRTRSAKTCKNNR